MFDQLVAPPLHCRSTPAGNRILIDTFILVGDDQILVDADHLPITLRNGGRLPTDCLKLNRCSVGCFEADTVQLETVGKLLDPDRLLPPAPPHRSTHLHVGKPVSTESPSRWSVSSSSVHLGPVDHDPQVVPSAYASTCPITSSIKRASVHRHRFAGNPHRPTASTSRSAPVLRPIGAASSPKSVYRQAVT